MISLSLNHQEILGAVTSLKGSDYLKAVMGLYLDSYSTQYTFNEFYLQYEQGTVTAVIHRYNSFVHIICSNSSDYREISAFIVGFSDSVLITDNIFLAAEHASEKCCIMSKIGHPTLPDSNVKEASEYLKTVSDLISTSMNESEKTDFYLNINHQVRHNNLAVFARFVENNPVSVAGVTKSYNGISAITFVYTGEYFRGNGYSKEVLDTMCSDVHTEYQLICEEHNLNFYKKCGFTQVGTCFQIRL